MWEYIPQNVEMEFCCQKLLFSKTHLSKILQIASSHSNSQNQLQYCHNDRADSIEIIDGIIEEPIFSAIDGYCNFQSVPNKVSN